MIFGEELVLTERQKEIYNYYLKALGSIKERGSKGRKNFDDFDNTQKLVLQKLERFFNTYKHISPYIFFRNVLLYNKRDYMDISEFIKRYPKTIVGYVLNTSTYASGNGRHWVALIFKGSEAHLFCSQGGDFSCFDDPDLVKNINSCCITTINSSVTIQTDNCNCGIYAVLANLICVLYCSGNQKISNKHLMEHKKEKQYFST